MLSYISNIFRLRVFNQFSKWIMNYLYLFSSNILEPTPSKCIAFLAKRTFPLNLNLTARHWQDKSILNIQCHNLEIFWSMPANSSWSCHKKKKFCNESIYFTVSSSNLILHNYVDKYYIYIMYFQEFNALLVLQYH